MFSLQCATCSERSCSCDRPFAAFVRTTVHACESIGRLGSGDVYSCGSSRMNEVRRPFSTVANIVATCGVGVLLLCCVLLTTT